MWSRMHPELESPFAPTPPEQTGAHFHLLCVLGSKETTQLEPMEIFRQISLLLECNTLEKSQVQLKCPWKCFSGLARNVLVKTQLRPSSSPPSAGETRGLTSPGPVLGMSFCDISILQVRTFTLNKITVAGSLFLYQFLSFI